MTAIYLLTNRTNGKQYVGQTQNFTRRLREHTSRRHSLRSVIGHALLKYGVGAFFVETVSFHEMREEANFAERELIARLDTIAPNGYNLRAGGLCGEGVSEETRRKIGARSKERGVSKAAFEAAWESTRRRWASYSPSARREIQERMAAGISRSWTAERREAQADRMSRLNCERAANAAAV